MRWFFIVAAFYFLIAHDSAAAFGCIIMVSIDELGDRLEALENAIKKHGGEL